MSGWISVCRNNQGKHKNMIRLRVRGQSFIFATALLRWINFFAISSLVKTFDASKSWIRPKERWFRQSTKGRSRSTISLCGQVWGNCSSAREGRRVPSEPFRSHPEFVCCVLCCVQYYVKLFFIIFSSTPTFAYRYLQTFKPGINIDTTVPVVRYW